VEGVDEDGAGGLQAAVWCGFWWGGWVMRIKEARRNLHKSSSPRTNHNDNDNDNDNDGSNDNDNDGSNDKNTKQ
jgi:hypothetical protein